MTAIGWGRAYDHALRFNGGRTWVSTSDKLPLDQLPVGPVGAKGIGYHDQQDRYSRVEIR